MTVLARTPATALAIAAICLVSAFPARAERADRDKPISLEADRVTVDDKKKVQVFDGHVRLSQGSLAIQAERIVVTQDAAGYQKGVATGAPARFRAKREGRDEFIEGEALRIEHDTRTGRTEFFDRAVVKSGGDEVRGQFIRYDATSETYLVNGAREGAAASSAGNRVHAILQPRRNEGRPAAPADSKTTKE